MDQIKLPSYLTTVLKFAAALVAGYLLKSGLITADQLPELGAGALALATLLWGLWSKRKTRETIKDAIAAPVGFASVDDALKAGVSVREPNIQAR